MLNLNRFVEFFGKTLTLKRKSPKRSGWQVAGNERSLLACASLTVCIAQVCPVPPNKGRGDTAEPVLC